MRFEVTFRNTQTTDALLQRAERKFSKVAKHLREPVEAHLVVQVEKHRHMAEMTVTTGRETLKVQDETDDMYRTIDRVMHKLERIARRAKERQQDRWHAPGEGADGFTLAQAAHEVEEEEYDFDEVPMTEELPKA
ncbi:MAG: ribosome-associated translation inhibitor RaiA [Pseudomonadota bacterium]